ncbi:hypothetical protein GCM10010329_07850 [Streptomyces spiroverticillatus]|uniref:Secreted protein n=1 Tax=Streptomyces finlayi TaxID=67296 RepID=A0A919C7B8_9ACTN|nr:hypothetical protein [Streptomyces finlayi]GGZ89842.1 hypothetical protein GCM10010329_07850 [Streptomyces spiroverticillatus]GHC80650.1 hypothetical protein GCM10010334_07840 [Streptomyces finlayi]
MTVPRTRRMLTAAAGGAAALLACLPGVALAAEGEFSYVYDDAGHRTSLVDPPSGTCILLPGVDQTWMSLPPMIAPHNGTDRRVYVYESKDCTGPSYGIDPMGTEPPLPRVPLRSARFS